MTLTLLIYCLYHCPSHYCKVPVCQFGHFNCLCIALHCKWRFLHCRALAHDAWTWYCEEHTLTKYGTTYCIPYYAIGSLMKQYNTHNHFTALFPGLPGWTGVRRNLLLDFMLQGGISEADTPTMRLGATTSGLISDPRPSSHIFAPDALPAVTLPIYPGLGQAPNMLACIPSGLADAV